MRTQVERIGKSRVKLQVEVDADRLQEAVERAYRRLVRRVHVPGFRPGKAPRRILEMRIGKDALRREALEELIPQVYREAAEQAAIEPVDEPDIDLEEFEEGKPLRFQVQVDVKPEVQLGDYKGLALEKVKERVSDADVEAVLADLRERNAELVAADKTAVAEGDYAVIDFEGLVDGKPFSGGAARGYTLRVGAGEFIPGFAEQLVGMQVGEEREISVTFPENDRRQDLAGKGATFRIKLLGVKVRRVPELDDEFAKDVSDMETLAELRADIRRKLEEAAEQRASAELREAAARAAAERAEVEIPHSMVEHEVKHMVREIARDLAARGVRLEDYLEAAETTPEAFLSDLRPRARQRVLINLALEAVAQAEGITPSEEELTARIDRWVNAHGKRAEEARKAALDPDRRAAFADSVRRRKAVDFLVAHAAVTEREVDPRQRPEHSSAPGKAAAAARAEGGEQRSPSGLVVPAQKLILPHEAERDADGR